MFFFVCVLRHFNSNPFKKGYKYDTIRYFLHYIHDFQPIFIQRLA